MKKCLQLGLLLIIFLTGGCGISKTEDNPKVVLKRAICLKRLHFQTHSPVSLWTPLKRLRMDIIY
ncbi:hypothetical protein D1970_20685 [Mesobacillus zeae]|uniref:Lipoprotein n=1 Tax=Mesobacillus zeae TaxID=1917180 RepID=A0A398AWB8_9BACI|nr:hypothetical protein D1970_20685 [Mesobacillus zeae]